MRATSYSATRTGIGTLFRVALVSWTIYSWTQQTRQAAALLPLWLYRIAKTDRSAITDALLCSGSYILVNGIPGLQLVVDQILPSWLLEERIVELQIFTVTAAMALFAGLIALRGEDSTEKTAGPVHYIAPPLFLLSLVSSLWVNEIRTIQDLLRLVFPQWVLDGRSMELRFFLMASLMILMAGIIVWRGEDKPHIKIAEAAPSSAHAYPLPPLLIPGRTTHTRLFPEKHSFDYSYLSVGVPIGWTGCVGTALSADINHLDHLSASKRKRGWFDVDAKDYLSRDGHDCLEHKLKHYLREQDVPDKDWSFAYLVTAPKFLGYSFNPVSFWYIYNDRSQLRMMILEVNNTFDERRMYLLKAESIPSSTRKGEAEAEDGEPSPENSIKFSNAWQKDFHVSPFNDRAGTYSLTATDPLAALANKSNHGEKDGKVFDNVIVLRTPDGKAKLVARVFSDVIVDPSTLTSFDLSLFLARWFWVGFFTFPRILRQAWTLYFKKKLDLWYKPEPLPTSLGRHHAREEATIEHFFRAYLQHLVSISSSPLRVSYTPPGEMAAKHTFVSAGLTVVDEVDSAAADVHIRVTSPTFYSRFVHYSHTREAMDREGLAVDDKNKTVLIAGWEKLSELLGSPKTFLHSKSTSNSKTVPDDRDVNMGVTERMRWTLLTRLRCPPPAVSYPSTSSSQTNNPSVLVSDIRASPPSDLDLFVQRTCEDRDAYVSAATRLFLAERYTAGFTAAFDVLDFVSRAAVALIAVASRSAGLLGVLNVWSLVKKG